MSELVVETTHGAVRGRMRGGVATWRGIPYAEPPVGDLRFRPPRPPRPWTGERDSTRFSPVAPQTRDPGAVLMSGVGDKHPMGEDCLALNIYSPAADGRRRPVVVWIHGGAFVLGAGSAPIYDGTSFAARHDIVVVTLNYRLGLLGFLYLGDLAGDDYASGNCGLLDQIAALTWVRDNIAGFGGDPDQVTVMGQSAGAISIATLLAMPAASGLFGRAILQSGASGLRPPGREDASRLARAVVEELAIDPARARALADVPVEQLLAAQERLGRRWGVGTFTPYVDGVTLTAPPIEIVGRGQGAHVPLLLGTNADEWSLFDAFLGEPAILPVKAQLEALLGDELERLHAAYRDAREDRSAARAWVDLVGDAAFRIPTIRLAEAQAACRIPVWMYRFDWATAAFGGQLGAAHAVDLPFVWNMVDHPAGQFLIGGDSPAARSLATLVHDTWAAFIRRGDPNGAGLPEWPPYEAADRVTMLLDRSCSLASDPDGPRRVRWPA